MDEFNLIEFNSPIEQTKALSLTVTDIPDVSPGNNPFDSLSKQTEGLCNTQTKTPVNFQASPTVNEDFFKISADIQSFGRESLQCLCDFDISGRESLGILKLDLLNFSFNNDNLSTPSVCTSQLNILEEQTSKEFSNGPLNTAFLHPLSYCRRKQSILSSNSSVSTNPSSFFNSGSLEASEPSKIYSLNNTKNFDLTSKTEEVLNNAFLQTVTNKLKFSDTSTSNSSSYLEIARQNLDENLNESKQRILSLSELKTTEIETANDYDKSDDTKSVCGYERSCWSESEIGLASLRKHVAESHANDIQEVDETFDDSVFIEANHLASKIADGSILVGQSFEENLLDCTSPPSFDDLEENESDDVKINAETVFKVIDKMLPLQHNPALSNVKEKETSNTPVYSSNLHVSNTDHVNNDISSLCQSSNSSNFSTTEFKENRTNISNVQSENHSENHCISQGSSSGSAKSRDANELLHDLSEIINHEYIDSKQKMEGQQLLFSLANILCTNGSNIFPNKYDNLDDSGHSSIEHEEQQNHQDVHTCYEVLDLRVVASKSNEDEQVLDLSMASKIENTNKRLSQSFSFSKPKFPAAKLINGLKTQGSLKSTSSLEVSKDKSDHGPGKLKPKRIEEKNNGTKKGPLKAIIPLGNMSKLKSSKMQSASVTPPKMEQAHSTLFKVKRTSTPIAEPQLKPVAQSTPDGSKPNLDRSKPISCSSQLKKRKFYCPVSPLARPSSIGDASTNADLNKSSHSGSAPNLSNRSANQKRNSRGDSSIPSPKPMHRRHSATELKVTENNYLKLQRSYSIGKDLKTFSIVNKMKENVRATLSSTSLKASNTSLSKLSPANQKNSVLHEKNSGSTSKSKIKSFTLVGKLKRSGAGKENIDN